VFEGAEERVNQLTVGVLERLGIGKAPWERDEEEYGYTPTVRTDNQLTTGVPLQQPKRSQRSSQPVVQEAWDEDEDYEWQQEQAQPKVLRQRQYEPTEYEDDVEEDNWSEATEHDRYEQPRRYAETEPKVDKQDAEEYEYDELEEDAWADEPKPVNIPKKTKAPEYEEEGGY
jgi:hypothetical protein